MTKVKSPGTTWFRGTLRQSKHGAFQAKRTKLTRLIRQRMRARYFPFSAPRPKPVDSLRRTILSPILEATESIYSVEDEFVESDGVHTPGECINVEDQAGRVMSWQRTPKSKLREPLPVSPKLDSIDFIVADYGQPDLNTEISNLIQHAWYENYELLRPIQGGAQGDIELCKHKPTGKVMVVKTVKTENALPLEAVLLQDFLTPAEHKNIVQLHTLFYDPELSVCNMVMEYCDGGDLHSFATHWLVHKRQNVPEIFLLHFISSISEALGFLHLGKWFLWNEESFEMPTSLEDTNHRAILHRDIKLDNIFMRWSSENKYGLPDIVLGDFGGSCLQGQAYEAFGTPGYWAPEVERWMNWDIIQAQPGEVMTAARDIYSFAVTLVSLFMVVLGEFHPSMDWASPMRQSNLRGWPLIYTMLQRCLDPNPANRLSTETSFNFSPMFRMHVRAAHALGTRMPEDSWPTPHATGLASNEAIYEQPPDYSEVDSGEWPIWDDDDVTPVEFTDPFTNPFTDPFADSFRNADAATTASPTSSASSASIHTAIFVPVQKAVEVDLGPLDRLAATRKRPKTLRISGLFEAVENLANGLVSNAKAVAAKRSSKSTPGKRKSPPSSLERLSRQVGSRTTAI